MNDLHRFVDNFPLELSPEILAARVPSGFIALPAGSIEKVESDIDLADLDNVIATGITSHGPYDTSVDKAIAKGLHAALPVSRRLAADRRMWAWLGYSRHPDFVAHRWAPTGTHGLRTPDRFVGGAVRQTFARLWWAVELTKAYDGSYDLTDRLLNLRGFQDVNEAVFGRAFCQYPPAIKAFIEVVGDKPEKIVRRVAKEFGYLTTTLVLEAMDEDEITDELENILNLVE